MVESADAGQANDSAGVGEAQTKAPCDLQCRAIVVTARRGLPGKEIGLDETIAVA
jgi:hypothetical protein